MICLAQAMDPRVVTRRLPQFVNAESIQKRGQLYLLVDRPEEGTALTIRLLSTSVKETGLQSTITTLQDLGDGLPGCHTHMWIRGQVQAGQYSIVLELVSHCFHVT
jgi:hypothetical protein